MKTWLRIAHGRLDGKVLIVKDFTAVLTMPHEGRTEILGTLRDAYDGEASKAFGTGETRSYRSRFGLIGAVTPVIDRYWGVSAQLGERFLRFRLSPGRREAKVERALRNVDDERLMRQETAAAALGVLAQAPATPTVPDAMLDQLIYLAEFVSRARSEVARDRQGVIEYVPSPEVGTRVGKAFKKLAMGITMARGVSGVTPDVYELVCRVALDTIPSMRARLLRVLWGLRDADCKTAFVADLAEIPTDTAKTWLDDLRLLGIVDRDGHQHTGYRWQLRGAFQRTVEASGLAVLWAVQRSNEEGVGGDSAPLTPLTAPETGWPDQSVSESVRGAESGGSPLHHTPPVEGGASQESADEVPF